MKSSKGKVVLTIFIVLFVVVFTALGIVAARKFLLGDKSKGKDKETAASGGGTKTLMIYMCGSDLESKSGIASSNLQDLISSKVDYKNMNIVVCAGGSSRWYNSDISTSETSYFNVTSSGVEQVKKQSKKDMAQSQTLTDFINYVYKNYESDEYYLMFWDHGCALYGLEHDELSENILSLKDLDSGLKNSKINKDDKKFSLIILNNCLMGSLETANLLANYSDYLVASEDVMYGGRGITTFEFLEGIKKGDNAIKIGESYINAYSKAMKKSNPDAYVTMALIDLSKIKKVVNEVDKYFGAIDLDEKTYKKISKVRAKVYEYQKSSDVYDMVDLYQLATKLKNVNEDNKSVLNAIEDAVLYKSVTDPYSHGISMYFPETHDWSEVYRLINFSSEYKTFVQNYVDRLTGKKTSSLSIDQAGDMKDVTKSDSCFSMQLTEEQKEDYKSSQFLIFEDNGDGTYTTVLTSSDTEIDDNGVVSAKTDNKLLSVVSKLSGEYAPVGYLIEVDRTDAYVMYDVPLVLVEQYGEDYVTPMSAAFLTIKVYNDGKVEKVITRSCSSPSGVDGRSSSNGAILDISDSQQYKSLYFINTARKLVLDDNGNYQSLGDATSTEGISFKINEEFTFEKKNLDPNKKYVGVFVVTDVYNKKYSSKLIEIKGE